MYRRLGLCGYRRHFTADIQVIQIDVCILLRRKQPKRHLTIHQSPTVIGFSSAVADLVSRNDELIAAVAFPIVPFVRTIQKVVLATGTAMFNAPRPMASSYSYTDPLSNSAAAGAAFGELDPWSSAPSPAGSVTPARATASASEGRNIAANGNKEEGLNGLISECTGHQLALVVRAANIAASETLTLATMADDPPALYVSLLDQLDTSGTGEVSLAAVHRLLGTSKLPAVVVEKVRP